MSESIMINSIAEIKLSRCSNHLLNLIFCDLTLNSKIAPDLSPPEPMTFLKVADYDAIVIGAGFSGIRSLWELGQLNLTVRCFEAGSDVGGAWYWNRYPGARTDSEAWVYAMNFIPGLREQWNYSERYPSQQEVQRYLSNVVG
jgi:hypothetical protein